MDRRAVAEIVVLLGDSQVAVAHVRAGAAYVVGRTRDADLALDVPTFAMVASTAHGFVVRDDGAALPQPLEPGAPRTLAFGPVTITVSVVALARTPVPRRGVERRPYGFGAASLALHAAVLLAAAWFGARDHDDPAPGTESSRRRPVRIARFAVAAQTVKRDDKPAPPDTPITTDDTPSTEPVTDEPSHGTAPSIASRQSPHGRGDKVASTSDSMPSPGDELSIERRFDPTDNPAFDTVKVGNYTTVSSGKTAGEQYELAGANGERKPLIVVSCDAASCIVIGGDAADGVRSELQRRLPEIVACYEQHAQTAGKKVELDFGIDSAGKVESVSVGGVGDYDACVAGIIRSIQFGT